MDTQYQWIDNPFLFKHAFFLKMKHIQKTYA